MGVHHYNLSMIPRVFLEQHPELNIGQWSEDQIDLTDDSKKGCWAKRQPSEDILNRVRGLLPNNKSWGSVEEFKSQHEWGSDIRIWKTDDNIVWSIIFRFSLADSITVLKQYLDIARDSNSVLYEHESGQLLKPEYNTILESLKKSRAFRFTSDPEGTIIEAAKKMKAEDS